MRQMIERVALLVVLGGASCDGGKSYPCDDGTPTCDSSLLVLLPDPRTEFTLTLEDDAGMDFTVTCPLAEGDPGVFDDYTVVCGGGRLTITTFRYFSETISVQLEEAEPRNLPANQQRGADFCGNTCNTGTVQL